MKVKKANLTWNVLCKNNSKIDSYNILGYSFAEELAKDIKKYKIENRIQLKDHLKKEFMYRYWSKAEFEIMVGGLHSKYPEEFKKIDIWHQIKMNFDHIIDYIILKMDLFK